MLRTSRSRALVLSIVVVAGCKTATEKQCDELFTRFESCSGKTMTDAMDSAAHAKCYISLGQELQPGDTTSFAAVEKAAFRDCAATPSCDALTACFTKHECRWLYASPGAEPFFACSQ